MKKIVGYVRDIPGGQGLSGVPVNIRLAKDGTLVPVGGMAGAGINPVNTDANGRFEWSCELSPGPLRVEAAIDSTAEMKVRVGEEVMQAGDIFISDIPTMGQSFKDGIIKGMEVAPVTGQMKVSVAAGAANIAGRIFELNSSRTISIDSNSTLANRYDSVYIEQHLEGTDAGLQQILVQKGTTNGVIPVIQSTSSVRRMRIGAVKIPQGATSVTVSHPAPTVAPQSIDIEPGSVDLTHLTSAVKNKLTDAMFNVTSPASGQILEYDGSKWRNYPNLLSRVDDTTIASPTSGQVLTYYSGSWRNRALPAPPTVSIASATDSTISSPAQNQVLTYYSGRWRNRSLPSPPTVSIAAASDTSLSGLAANQVLTYVSPGVWKNKALPSPPTVSIAAASDSTISSPSNGQVLAYSSGRWRNSTLNISIPSSKFAQTSFGTYGNLPGANVLLASTAVSVPAGTWLLKAEAYGQYYGNKVGGGSNNIWFQGNSVDGISLGHRQLVATSDQGVDRHWTLSTGRIITRSNTGTYTLDLWVSGGNIYMRGGKLMLSAT